MILFLSIPVPRVYADEQEEEPITDQVQELLEALDLSELQAYLDELDGAFDIKQMIEEFISGDFQLKYDSLADVFLSVFTDCVVQFLPFFAVLLAITLLYGLFAQLKTGVLGGATDSVLYYICLSAILTVLLALLIQILGDTLHCVTSLQTQMQLVLPVLLTLMAASGGTVSVAVYQPAVAFLSTGIVTVITEVVFPVAAVQIVLTIVGNLSDGIKLGGFSKFFGALNRWLLGILLTSFSLFLSVQGIAAGIYDGFSLRALKYAIGTGVPIVGGFLSSGFDLVVAGSILIKNTLGGLSIFLLVFVLFRPLMGLLVVGLLLKLASAIAESVNGEKLAAFYQKLSGDLNYYVAGLLGVGFLYFMTLLLLVCSFSAL